MKPIIVTVVDKRNRVQYDLELPTDVRIDDLLDDIVQTLNSCDGNYRPQPENMGLYVPRLNRTLSRSKTLGEEAVWNGDYLELAAYSAKDGLAGTNFKSQ